MSDRISKEPEEATPVGGELVIPIAALAFTGYYVTTIIDSPWTAQVSAFFIGAVLTVLVLVFLARTAMAVRSGRASLAMGPLAAPVSLLPKRLALLGLTFGFVILVQYAGFTLSTFAFMSLAMLLLAGWSKVRTILWLSAVLALGGYLLFILAFETRFPAGPFELLMKQVLQ